jgi:hypothetical protein
MKSKRETALVLKPLALQRDHFKVISEAKIIVKKSSRGACSTRNLTVKARLT